MYELASLQPQVVVMLWLERLDYPWWLNLKRHINKPSTACVPVT
jgi:hypothetical protein